MYSLYLKPGDYYPEELIDSTLYGIYGREFGEGKIYFDKNIFYFNIRDARLIEKGKLTLPLGNIVVTGDIIEVLSSVDMVANDFRYDKGVSYCFKNGQTLNVRVGQPTVKINNLYVTKDTKFP
jgi:TldD protein